MKDVVVVLADKSEDCNETVLLLLAGHTEAVWLLLKKEVRRDDEDELDDDALLILEVMFKIRPFLKDLWAVS